MNAYTLMASTINDTVGEYNESIPGIPSGNELSSKSYTFVFRKSFYLLLIFSF